MNIEKELENIELENYLLGFDLGELEFINDIGINELDDYIEKNINKELELMDCSI